MNRVLFVTTALCSTLALGLSARADMEVTIGGFTSLQAAWFDNDDANSSHRDFQSESEIYVSADGTADNGLQYGAYIQVEASTNDTLNTGEQWVYLEGGWGRLELGDSYGAGRMGVTAPIVGIGQINGSYDDFVPAADLGHFVNDRGLANFLPFDSEYATKISYFTPIYEGLQAGLSYVPEVDSQNSGEQVQFSKTAGNHRDMVEAGLTYEREISGVNLSMSGNYNHADAKTGSGLEDVNSWGLGAQLGYAGFRFGGGYTDDGDSGNPVSTADDTVTGWNVGATYEQGAWGVGVSYLAMDYDANGDAGSFLGTDGAGGDYNALVLGGTYAVAPGLSVGADLAFYDRNRATGTDTNGTVLMTDVTAAF